MPETCYFHDQAALLDRLSKGLKRRAQEVVFLVGAMTRWEEEERWRTETAAAINEGADDLEAGRYRDYTDSTLPQLALELKPEGRALGAAKKPARGRSDAEKNQRTRLVAACPGINLLTMAARSRQRADHRDQ